MHAIYLQAKLFLISGIEESGERVNWEKKGYERRGLSAASPSQATTVELGAEVVTNLKLGAV